MHVTGESIALSGKSHIANSPIWRIAIAIFGIFLCLIGGQTILQSLFAAPNSTGHGAAGFSLTGALWAALCVTSAICAIILLARGFGSRLGYHWIALLVGIALMSGATSGDIVLFLLAAGLLLRSQNHVIAASLAFTAMMLLQPVMAAVLIYFVLRADWRMARWGLGMGAAAILASFPLDWPNLIEAAQRFVSSPLSAGPDNQSAYGFVQRMFDDPALVPVFMAPTVALAGVLAVVGLHLGKNDDVDEDARPGPTPAILLLECSLIVALAMACGLLTKGSHMAVALAGLAGALIVGLERIRAKSKHANVWTLAILAWIPPVLLALLPDLQTGKILAGSGGAIALFLAGASTAVVLWRERKAAAEIVIPQRPFGKRRRSAQPAPAAIRAS